jgi:hypothetical protein
MRDFDRQSLDFSFHPSQRCKRLEQLSLEVELSLRIETHPFAGPDALTLRDCGVMDRLCRLRPDSRNGTDLSR